MIPDFGTVQGAFQLPNLEFAGEHNGEVTYDVALEAAGELTFTAMYISTARALFFAVIARESGRSSSHRAIGVYWMLRLRGA